MKKKPSMKQVIISDISLNFGLSYNETTCHITESKEQIKL